jgi:hypothetical protein
MKGKDLKQIMRGFGLTQQGLAEIAVKSLKLSARKEKTMPLDLRKRKPVVCSDCGQQLFAELSKKNPGQAAIDQGHTLKVIHQSFR